MQMEEIVSRRPDILFCFAIVLHFEDVDHERLSVLSHVAQDNSLGFIESRICVTILVRICAP